MLQRIKQKKGQGLPLQTIIIAALVLIVLIVLIAIFTGRIKLFGTSIEDCKAKGGKGPETDCANDEIKVKMKREGYCCLPVFEKEAAEKT